MYLYSSNSLKEVSCKEARKIIDENKYFELFCSFVDPIYKKYILQKMQFSSERHHCMTYDNSYVFVTEYKDRQLSIPYSMEYYANLQEKNIARGMYPQSGHTYMDETWVRYNFDMEFYPEIRVKNL